VILPGGHGGRRTRRKRKRFSEEQIIRILNEAAADVAAVEVCRRYGISEATFYRWMADFGGVAVNDTKRLRQIEAENSSRSGSWLLAEAHLVPTSGKGQLDFEQDPLETVSLRCMSGMAERPWRRARL
jgi:putative transposase